MKADVMLADYVYSIAELPKLPQVCLTTPAELAIVRAEVSSWKEISLWLQNLVLYEALAPEAYEGDALYQMLNAYWLKALLELIRGVHATSGNPDIKAFSTPVDLWYHCVCKWAERELEDTGLFGLPPMIVPKRENYKAVNQLCSSLEKLVWEPDDCYTMDDYPEAIVFAEAQAIAKDDKGFRYRVLQPFLKEWRHIAKSVKNTKYLQDYCLLPHGAIFTTGKNRRLPPGL